MTQSSAAVQPWLSARRAPVPAMLVGGTVPALAVTVMAAVVCGIARGVDGAFGALAGGVLAVAFFALGALALNSMLRSWATGLAMTSALVVYVVQLLLVVAAALVLVNLPLDRSSIGIGLLAAALAFIVGQIVGFSRSRELVSNAPLPGDEDR
ncbi:hypothetical protein ACMYYO_04785 [Dermacoccaceae bacterium W4C1]